MLSNLRRVSDCFVPEQVFRSTHLNETKALRANLRFVSEISAASPQITLIAWGGRPASKRAVAIMQAVAGVSSAGLTTTEQPAASAGAIFCIGAQAGKFQGEKAATGPTGRRCTASATSARRAGISRP